MNNDWCTEDGAKRLKDKIEQYWVDRGFNVNIDLVDACFIAAMRSSRTDVRSNMVNGMPRLRAPIEAGAVRRSSAATADESRFAVA